MDVLEIIKSRRSIRAFKKETVPKEIIKECLETAIWAPSATNHQPWNFVVVTGKELDKIRDIVLENFPKRMQGMDAFSNVPGPCLKRQEELFETLFRLTEEEGIDHGNMFQRMLTFFEAPVGVFFVTYKRDDHQYRYSITAALENFLLAAYAKGLGTCWLGVAAACEEDIRNHLGISKEMEITGCIALGYPVKDSKFNTFIRTRVPADELTTWIGF